jgi:squalene-hopene/tetraprenyl-beta-curcumene cyclase
MKRKVSGLVIAGLTGVILTCARGEQPEPRESALTSQQRTQAEEALRKGLNWLAAGQSKDGSWSDHGVPALTGLPLWAFARTDHPHRDAIVSNAVRYLRGCVQPDGGIYKPTFLTGGLTTYNTAVCMTALHALGDPTLTPIVLKARTFMADSQIESGDDTDGGFGYSRTTHFVHADLQNTAMAMQAMRLTAGVEDSRPKGETRADLDWKRTVAFLERLQNKPSAGEENAGGMTYAAGGSIFGSSKAKDGTVVLRSSGTMTYAGLLSMIYADMARDDHRVRSAFDWATRHWTLDENPGVGPSGLYFYYHVMSRALCAFGADSIPVKDRGSVNWRAEYVAKLVAAQRKDDAPDQGFWVNKDSNRFWEGNPVLVTAYCIMGLQSAMGR